MTASYIFAIGVMALIMAVSFVMLRIAQSRGLCGPRVNPIRVVAQQSLGAGSNAILLDLAGEHILVGVSKSGVTLLHASNHRPAAIACRPEGNVMSFSTVLKRAGARS